LIKNFSKLKNLMSSFKEDNLNEDKIIKLMDLWKSNETIEFKLKNKFPEVLLILKWLINLLELRIKNNSYLNIQEKQSNLQKEIQYLNNQIKEINSDILNMKLNLKKIKFSIENIKTKSVKYL
jgi:peptidoglycan hydrolase CwlO-like protein